MICSSQRVLSERKFAIFNRAPCKLVLSGKFKLTNIMITKWTFYVYTLACIMVLLRDNGAITRDQRKFNREVSKAPFPLKGKGPNDDDDDDLRRK